MARGVMAGLLRTRVHRRLPWVATLVRIVAGVFFVVYGLPKFTDHAGWVAGFGGFGLPESSLLVYATGAVEVLGGLALIVGLAVRPVAALLALVMVGAAVFGGVLPGNPASLLPATALLAAMVVVLWSTVPGSRRVT